MFLRAIPLALIQLTILAAPSFAFADDLPCTDKQEFTLTAEGGSFEYKHIKVSADKGDLTADTRFVAEVCPTAFDASNIAKEMKYLSEEKKEVVGKVAASEKYPSIKLKAPDGLAVADDATLSYCLVGSEEFPVDGISIYHEGQAAPLVAGHETTSTENCVRFHSLSFWHHITHPHIPNPIPVITGGLSSAVSAMKHGAEDAGKVAVKAGKAGFNAIKGLLHPCSACKSALNAGIKYFECKMSGSQARKAIERCSEEVSEEEPEIAEYSPLLCGAIEQAASAACKHGHENTKAFDKVRSKVVDDACKAAHICG